MFSKHRKFVIIVNKFVISQIIFILII